MNIGQAAAQAGVPAKTIRYYEEIGLVAPARDPNGYRAFSPSDIHKLAFLGRARRLGFSVEDCRTLLALWEDQSRASSDVRTLARQHLARIEQKLADLQGMHDTLSGLVRACAGDDRPDCPILADLAGQPVDTDAT